MYLVSLPTYLVSILTEFPKLVKDCLHFLFFFSAFFFVFVIPSRDEPFFFRAVGGSQPWSPGRYGRTRKCLGLKLQIGSRIENSEPTDGAACPASPIRAQC